MRRSTKRLLFLLASIPVLLLSLALLYQQAMTHLEGEPRTLWDSIEWASETITSTGYGHDNEWDSPVLQVFVIAVQFLGLFLAFLVFPVFLIPFFEERFEGRLPKHFGGLRDHVVIYRWGPAVSSLIDELDHASVPVLILEEDETIARRLHDRGRAVIHLSFEDEDPDLSDLDQARGVVANGSDHENALFTMAARQQGYEGTIVALVESPKRRGAMTRAGATAVFTPKHALAAAIAAKASAKLTPRVSGAPMLSEQVVVGEVRVARGSSLAGGTLGSSKIGSETGATVVGVWQGGELLPATPSTELRVGSILVAAGSHDNMEALATIATPMAKSGPFVVCGFGETGRKVVEFLTDAGEEVVIVDSFPSKGVTHVGDALDPDLLTEAGVENAQAVILTLGDDAETVFAAAVVRDLASETVIISYAQRASNVARMHRAGADFGFSIGQVASQLMMFQLLGKRSVSLQPQIKIARLSAGTLVGKDVLSSDVRGRTGCSIVAVERGVIVHVELDADFVIEADDALYVSGTVEAVDQFCALFDAE